MNTNINTLRDLRFKSMREVQEDLGKKSDEELVKLFTHIIEDNPFLYKYTIEFIVNKLYSTDEPFVELLCSLIEKTVSDLAFSNIIGPITKVALNNPEKTLAITNKMIDLRIGDGMCSGILISPLLCYGTVGGEIFSYIVSDDLFLQRHSLFAICNAITTCSYENIKTFIKKLIKVADSIDEENTDILIQCLMNAFLVNKDLVVSVLEKEIEKRGYTAAII